MKLYILIALIAITASQVLSQDCTPLRCTLPVKPGDCTDSLPKWYFDNKTKQCRIFIYTGCGGNVNRFQTKQLCENNCLNGCSTNPTKKPTSGTTVSPLPPRCHLKLNPGNCDKAIPRFYYDKSANKCKAFNYTGCGGNVNNFKSQELCEENCVRK